MRPTMRLAMAGGLQARQLARAIQDSPTTTLLLDCRSFIAYNSTHIQNAHNVHCPPILKRRSGGSLSLENAIRCARTRSKLLSGKYKMVVAYDDSTVDSENIPMDSNLFLVLKTLREDTDAHVYFLQGGFQGFYRDFGFLCGQLSGLTAGLTVDFNAVGASHVSPRLHGDVSHPYKHTPYLCHTHDQGDPVEVMPWLYLGSFLHAAQPSRLNALGINALLNVSATDPPNLSDQFCYKIIPVSDNSIVDIINWFPEAIEFIDSVRDNGGKVLVHCQAGVSRSATICLAYLMRHKNLSLENAYDYLKSRRQVIAPNLNFMRQLLEYEVQLKSERKQQKAQLTLALTPSSSRATVFVFDAPIPPVSPLRNSPLHNSPVHKLCPSPLFSPS